MFTYVIERRCRRWWFHQFLHLVLKCFESVESIFYCQHIFQDMVILVQNFKYANDDYFVKCCLGITPATICRLWQFQTLKTHVKRGAVPRIAF